MTSSEYIRDEQAKAKREGREALCPECKAVTPYVVRKLDQGTATICLVCDFTNTGVIAPERWQCEGSGQKGNTFYGGGKAECPACSRNVSTTADRHIATHYAPLTCQIRVGEVFYRHACGRNVPEGESVCKVHLEHRRRAAVKHAAWKAEFEAHRVKQNAAIDLADQLAVALRNGDGVRANYEGTKIEFSLDAAQRLLTILTKGLEG